MYSIKAVSQATGLSVETLRAWERRYHVVIPLRDGSGRRVYRPDDVMRLRRLREATERGHPISRLAALDDAALAALFTEAREAPAAGDGALVARILEAARQFHVAECEQAVTLAIALLPPMQLVHQVLRPLLHEVGERWHRGEFSIAQERLVSGCVRKHVGSVLDTYDRSALRQSIVFATLPGERHELGLLMSAVVCSSRGFKCHYLGTDLPGEEIARFAQQVSSTQIALSIVMLESLAEALREVRSISKATGGQVSIWIGGAAGAALPRVELPPECAIIADQFELERRLELMHAA